MQTATQVACSDGTTRTFYHDGSAFSTGRLVTVTVNSSGTTVKSLSSRSLTGTVSSDGTRFAGYDFAADAEILDTDSEGGYVRIYPSRLAGSKLTSDNVRYYTLDENGDIDHLILEEATGDTRTYVYVTEADKSVSDTSVSGTYTYLYKGASSTVSGSTAYNVSAGGAVLRYDGGSLRSIQQLTSAKLTQLSDLYATMMRMRPPAGQPIFSGGLVRRYGLSGRRAHPHHCGHGKLRPPAIQASYTDTEERRPTVGTPLLPAFGEGDRPERKLAAAPPKSDGLPSSKGAML